MSTNYVIYFLTSMSDNDIFECAVCARNIASCSCHIRRNIKIEDEDKSKRVTEFLSDEGKKGVVAEIERMVGKPVPKETMDNLWQYMPTFASLEQFGMDSMLRYNSVLEIACKHIVNFHEKKLTAPEGLLPSAPPGTPCFFTQSVCYVDYFLPHDINACPECDTVRLHTSHILRDHEFGRMACLCCKRYAQNRCIRYK